MQDSGHEAGLANQDFGDEARLTNQDPGDGAGLGDADQLVQGARTKLLSLAQSENLSEAVLEDIHHWKITARAGALALDLPLC